MYCYHCHRKNVRGALFCAFCGTKLIKKCKCCDATVTIQSLYCNQCGDKFNDFSKLVLPLIEAVSDLTTQLFYPSDNKSQTLTILFCDLVGYTRISETLSPKDLHEVVKAYQSATAKVVAHFEGYVAQYLGDGILIYFGYPEAHEKSACQAIGASLEIIRTIKQLNQSLIKDYGLQLCLRQGIHKGSVVIGELGENGRSIQLAFGHAVNVAARLQEVASAGQVLLSQEVYQSSKAYFTFQSLGMFKLKNVSKSLEVFQVVGYKTKSGILKAKSSSAQGTSWLRKPGNGAV